MIRPVFTGGVTTSIMARPDEIGSMLGHRLY